MNYHQLLSEQAKKYLPESLASDTAVKEFLAAVNQSYLHSDEEKRLAELAFYKKEEEYLEVNKKLKHEVEVREQSVEKLKEAVGKITADGKASNTDDLLMIARYLNQQVSKRKNAELVFASLISNLPIAIMLEDEAGQVSVANQHFCNMFRVAEEPEVIIGSDCKIILEKMDSLFPKKENFITRVSEILFKRELVSAETISSLDGRFFERSFIPIFLEQKYKGGLWSYTDITESRKAAEEQKRISLVASANQSGVLFTSFDGRITWANDGFSKMTGYSMEEIAGKTPIELCRGPLTNTDSLEKVLNAFYSGTAFNIEIVYYRKDGSWFWGRSNTQPVKDKNGNVEQFFGIIDDVTEERETQGRLRMALDKIGDNVWEHNFINGETKFSDTENHLLGYSKKDFNNNVDLWWQNVCPDDKRILTESDERYKSGTQDHHTLEYRMIHKSGETRWVLDKGVVIEKSPTGKPLKIIGTHTDISSIKQAEKALRENEQRFRSLEENIPGILYSYEFTPGEKERFTYISPDTEKKIGLSATQIQDFYKIIHPEDKEREHEISEAAREKGTPYHFEGRFYANPSKIVWLSLSSSFSGNNNDGSTSYAGIIINITREKEAALQVQLKEKKYRNVIANMNLGLLEVNIEEKIEFANQSFCEMSGYAMQDLIGKSASTLFVRPEDNELMEIENDKRKQGISDAYEIMVKTHDGRTKWWLISGAPRYDDGGQLVGSIGIHLDITGQKMLEQELVTAREHAETSARAKQVFLANMSHEIRTPMNAILGMAGQLVKTQLNQDQHFYLNIMRSAADNLLIIINDILDLSKLEAGKLTLEEIGFKPMAIIEQSLQVMMHKAEEKGLVLTNSCVGQELAPVLLGDPYRLNQVLLNLFSNSIKFTERGSVDISCEVVSNSTTEQSIKFTVMDTGIGMEEEFLKSLFQKFRQEDESVTRRFGGTGLGMSICKELVEFMGGEITVQSKKGKGTQVSFTIPFKKGNESQLPVKATGLADASALAGKRILITDDNEMNRLVAATILGNYDTVLDEASNGIEAIEKIRTGKFDIVLMDVQMPVMDGIEATKIIRSQISKSLPVIALTALALKGDESRFLAAGMTDYLSKPFEENQLLQVLSKWLGAASVIETDVQRPEIENNGILYDLKTLHDISRGNQTFVDKMIKMFIEQGPSSVKEITESYQSGNLNTVAKVAHRMKASIDNMGISSLKLTNAQIEQLATSGSSSPELESLIKKLEITIDAVVSQLKEVNT